jgi:hypothetical protein
MSAVCLFLLIVGGIAFENVNYRKMCKHKILFCYILSEPLEVLEEA